MEKERRNKHIPIIVAAAVSVVVIGVVAVVLFIVNRPTRLSSDAPSGMLQTRLSSDAPSGRFYAPAGRRGLQFIPSESASPLRSNSGKPSSEYAIPFGGLAPEPQLSPGHKRGVYSEIQRGLQQPEFAGLKVPERNMSGGAKLNALLNSRP